MGAVYKARDPEIDRTVALKVVNPLLLAGDVLRAEFLERFRREARAAGRLSHPNIVSVHDLGTDESTGTPFIVMEYVAGTSLETVLKENPSLPVEQALEILEQVAAALAEAHRAGVIHRDVKPANVFLDARGRVKVGDFGIARLEGSELTQSGVGLGTPGYSAPEVLRGAPADARSDVFALGVLAYRLLTGQRPFEGATREATAIQILEHSPAPPSSLRPEVPAHVSSAVMRALARSPDERTPSAEAFAADLRPAAPHVPVGAPAVPSAPERAAPDLSPPTATIAVRTLPSARGRRRWIVALLLVLAALAVGALVALHAWPGAEARQPPSPLPNAPRESPPAARTLHPPAPSARPARATAPPAGGATAPAAPRRGQDPAAAIEDKVLEEAKRILEKPPEDDKKGHEPPGKGRKKGHGKGDKD